MSVLTWLKLIGAAALLGAVTMGVRSCAEGLREEGRVQVREQWLKADNQRELQERQALIDKQRTEREKEQRMARQAEEKEREQTQREDALRQRALAAERTADGLRGAVARLDEQSRARRAAGTCPAAEREADEAATARELLSACAGRYTAMATEAASLANQVMGLQDHVVVVQPEAAVLLSEGR